MQTLGKIVFVLAVVFTFFAPSWWYATHAPVYIVLAALNIMLAGILREQGAASWRVTALLLGSAVALVAWALQLPYLAVVTFIGAMIIIYKKAERPAS